ncbi:MAG: histidinol-phosphate transaminase [Thiotrichales bacterium]
MENHMVARWVRPEIRALSAYHVPSAEGLIKLDAMENPYTWPDSLVEEWLEHLRKTPVNRYPDPAGTQLVEKLRDVMRVPEGQAVLLGNGSDELIQIIIMAVAAPNRVVMAPEPGFVMYRMIAGFANMQYVPVPLDPSDFSLPLEPFLAAMKAHEPAVIFLAYPNNPTGNQWDREAIETIIEQAPGIVVLDEAYSPFASDSFMSDLGRYPNLLVMRTFSKLGLAGLRLGYLSGPPEWIEEFDKIRLPYNINTLTQVTTDFALGHMAIFEAQATAIKETRAELIRGLKAIPGLEVFPSEANFVMFRTAVGQAEKVFQGLIDQGVLIKNLSRSSEMLKDCLRVTVGTTEENARFLQTIRQLAST